jgi:hypothetical protein
MPVEIRELVIKTTIAGAPSKAPALDGEQLVLLKQQIVQDCLCALRDKASTRTNER